LEQAGLAFRAVRRVPSGARQDADFGEARTKVVMQVARDPGAFGGSGALPVFLSKASRNASSPRPMFGEPTGCATEIKVASTLTLGFPRRRPGLLNPEFRNPNPRKPKESRKPKTEI
jgi:hypothetical protein